MYKKITPSPKRVFDEKKIPSGLFYQKDFLKWQYRMEIVEWLKTLYPIWEKRYSTRSPLPEGKQQRSLLRPVYWLGNWQFACLNYYHPPNRLLNRCVKAEAYPPVLSHWVKEAEKIARRIYTKRDLPPHWELNTCLINFYGQRLVDGKWVDTARVGDHKDFEPGPVASLSLGERALFQFVASEGRERPARVIYQQWLEDGSLQIFGGQRWKEDLFHRVQRVDKKEQRNFPLNVENFRARRINFTFRYVPREHFVAYAQLPAPLKADVVEYMRELAKHSVFFAKELSKDGSS